jgi:hypothetical protein
MSHDLGQNATFCKFLNQQQKYPQDATSMSTETFIGLARGIRHALMSA